MPGAVFGAPTPRSHSLCNSDFSALLARGGESEPLVLRSSSGTPVSPGGGCPAPPSPGAAALRRVRRSRTLLLAPVAAGERQPAALPRPAPTSRPSGVPRPSRPSPVPLAEDGRALQPISPLLVQSRVAPDVPG